MIERLMFILVLAIQPSWLGVLLPREVAMASCVEPVSCCAAVEITTCCGEVIVIEQPCPMSGGDCFCGVTPQENQPKTPARPGTQVSDLMAWIPVDQIGVDVVFGSERPRSTLRASTTARLNRSHNQTQSLLGVWQT